MGVGLVLFYPDGDFCTGNLPLWLFLAARPSSDWSDRSWEQERFTRGLEWVLFCPEGGLLWWGYACAVCCTVGVGLVLFYPDGDFCTGNLPVG